MGLKKGGQNSVGITETSFDHTMVTGSVLQYPQEPRVPVPGSLTFQALSCLKFQNGVLDFLRIPIGRTDS